MGLLTKVSALYVRRAPPFAKVPLLHPHPHVSEQLFSHSLHFGDSLNSLPPFIFLLREGQEYLFHFIDDEVFSVFVTVMY